METLKNIWSSITGHINTRAKDPVLGSFVVAWVLCNWDKLTLLILGEAKVEERIAVLVEKMAVFENKTLLYKDLDLVIFPAILAILYLFALPSVSLLVNRLQKKAILSQHFHAVEVETERAKKQWELNKVKLRSNPNKAFVEKDVELDIQKDKERNERRNKIREYIDQKVKAAHALTRKHEAEAAEQEQEKKKRQVELEEKERKNIIEKQRFERNSQIHQATLASNRFPVAYFFLNKLSESLREDSITLTLDGLSSCIAATFGYTNFQQLLEDNNFTNDNLQNLKYVLATDNLVSKLNEICQKESIEKNTLENDILFDHIQRMFGNLSYIFLSEEGLADDITNIVHEKGYDFLQNEELSGPIAETDTIFDEILFEQKDYAFNTDFYVEFNGTASGHHRKESDIKGRELNVWLKATCKPIIGKLGLGDVSYEISGAPRDYGIE
jgi:flagellar biosynthesis GTPase FlhF